MNYENIIVEKFEAVALIRLNRPSALNALSEGLVNDLAHALDELEPAKDIACVVLTGSQRAFCAGADIKELQAHSFPEVYTENFITRNWERIVDFRKPVIAAVSGVALGGGCELAMMCDFIIAARSARFAQPEIKVGVIPGAGGTQRLARWIGKSKAMEMCLTGRFMGAEEALQSGLVARVVDDDELVKEALRTASEIAGYSMPAIMMTKEAVNRAFETTLAEGIRFERRLTHATFALEDRKEGTSAFIEKRKPQFKHR